jgi:DNA-directed RNA polymerase specialized sigma subunit
MLDYLRRIDPLSRDVRRFQKQRDAIIADLLAAGETLSHVRVAQMLGVSLQKYVTLSRAIAAAEPVSVNDVANGWRLTG